MKIRKEILALFCVLLVAIVFLATLIWKTSSVEGQLNSTRPEFHFAGPSEGGLGIITDQLYAVTSSNRNELLLTNDQKQETWTGATATNAETVFYFNKKVYSGPNFPAEFSLTSSMVISFEKDRIYFYNFNAAVGSYYTRNYK